MHTASCLASAFPPLKILSGRDIQPCLCALHTTYDFDHGRRISPFAICGKFLMLKMMSTYDEEVPRPEACLFIVLVSTERVIYTYDIIPQRNYTTNRSVMSRSPSLSLTVHKCIFPACFISCSMTLRQYKSPMYHVSGAGHGYLAASRGTRESL